jgi:hypothetical protein
MLDEIDRNGERVVIKVHLMKTGRGRAESGSARAEACGGLRKTAWVMGKGGHAVLFY